MDPGRISERYTKSYLAMAADNPVWINRPSHSLVSKGSFIFPYDLPSCVLSANSPIFFLSLSLRPGRNLIAFRHFPYSPFENVPTQKQGKSSDNVGEMKKRSCRVSPPHSHPHSWQDCQSLTLAHWNPWNKIIDLTLWFDRDPFIRTTIVSQIKGSTLWLAPISASSRQPVKSCVAKNKRAIDAGNLKKSY